MFKQQSPRFLRASFSTNYSQSQTCLPLIAIYEGEFIFRKLYFETFTDLGSRTEQNNAFRPLAYSDFMQTTGKLNI